MDGETRKNLTPLSLSLLCTGHTLNVADAPMNDDSPLSHDAPPTSASPVPEILPAPANAPPAASADLMAVMADLKTRLVRVEASIKEQAESESGRQGLIDQLHAQLQEARSDLVWKILRPVLLDLTSLYDALTATIRRQEQNPDTPLSVTLLQDFRQDVEDILYRQGVTAYQVEGNRFDARKQQPARTRDAATAEEVGLVVERLAVGFTSEDRLLRPEKVVVLAAAAKKPDSIS
jgi:molecular chaperone GrpE